MIKKTYKKGYLSVLSNSKGTKKSVYIAERKDGFSAIYSSSGKTLKNKIKNPDKYAVLLAKKGHKKVSFRD